MYSLMLHGKRFGELQKWRGLRVSVQKAFPFCNSSFSAASAADMDGGKGQNFTVSYLVDSLGFTTKLAETISRKVSSEGKKGNSDSVLSLLRSYGFTDSHISDIIRTYPRLLISDADKSLGPKLQFLSSRGASTSELTEVLSKVPKILGIKRDKALSRYYDFVRDIIEADKSSKLERLCLSLPEGSRQENKLRNVLVLRELGVPQKFLFSLLISNFRTISGKEKFEESLKRVVEMGFDPTSSRFVQALNAVYGLSDRTEEEKVSLFKRLGFGVEDVWEMFKKNPAFMIVSEKKILTSVETFLGLGFTRDEFMMMVKRYPHCFGYFGETLKNKTEFLVKKMNWPLQAVVSYPPVLGMSMENRIVPRCNVINTLISKGLLESDKPPPIGSVLACTNEVFLQRYVRKHDNEELVAELMSIFRECRAS